MMILTIVVAAVSFSYYKRSSSPSNREKQATKLLAENISDSTQGFSFSQADHGKTTFEFRAKSKLGLKDNKILLEYITVKVYGKAGDRYDTITSNHCEYDQAADEIVFLDNVVIEFGPLDKVRNQNQTGGPGDPPLATTVKVDRIQYAQKTGIAETEEEVNFMRGRVHGKSRGLTYDSQNSTLHLHSQVEIFVEPAGAEDSQIQLKTASLTYLKPSNLVQMRSDVWIRKAGNETRADLVDAFLDPDDSSLTRINAAGNVHSVSRDPKSMMEVDAQKVNYFFIQGGRWLSKITAEGNVRSRSLNEEVRRDISSNRLEIILKPESHLVETVRAVGNVVAVLADDVKSVKVGNPGAASSPGPGDKVIKSSEILAFFDPEENQISRMEARGNSVLEDLPSQPNDDKRILSAQELTVIFETGSNKIEKCMANHDVRVNVIPAAGPVKRTSSDHLIALMDKQTHRISQFHQFGNFEYQEEGRQASSEEARYFAKDKIIRLQGHPQVSDASSRTSANTIELHQSRNLFEAQGAVRSVFYNQSSQSKTTMFEPGSSVYASAEFMEAETNTGVAKYWKQAKLWQQDQVIGAETIYLYRSEKKLVAVNNVRSLLYLENQKGNEERAQQKRQPVTIQARTMVYQDSLQKVLYETGVKMNGSMGILNSNRLEVFLASKDNQTTVKRLLATGAVTIHQPNRTSFSDFAEYFRDEEKLVLTGGSPRILDSERGSTVGARLTMHLDDGSIAVEGDPENRSITRQHVAR
jgi:lipopolysaccharide export system protein LptA